MTWFQDLTPHTYTPAGPDVLNVGWLDREHPFQSGETSAVFRDALARLCRNPILLHRGFHVCQFCHPARDRRRQFLPSDVDCGNGQIRILGHRGLWYAAPTLVHHYVVDHQYRPPEEFIRAVLEPIVVQSD